MSSPRLLLSSVITPLGPAHGDAASVGYEVLHAQVTRAQGLFSPRNVALHYGLDYIAANLDTPAVVLHYPSQRDFVRELRRGQYSHVGISFNLTTAHRMRRMSALVRRYAPAAQIVLGGYGTAIPDDELAPYGDQICRGEGVAFMRELLGEPVRTPPYAHPLLLTRMRLLQAPLTRSALIFAGLGCPNGCDFCSTSHHFKRRHIKLLPTGDDLFALVAAYRRQVGAAADDLNYTVVDEDFLLDRRRAMAFRDRVQEAGWHLDLFAFGSVKALSQYTATELVELGLGGVWIGYEGQRSGYQKREGRELGELIDELRRHGIVALTSMILGLDYQDREIIREEFEDLMAMEPTYGQYTIFAPLRGTPLHDRIEAEGRWRPEYRDPERRDRFSDAFACLFEHPKIPGAELEALQRWCFEEEYRRLGPSVVRYTEAWQTGYEYLRDRAEPALARRAAFLRRKLEGSLALMPVARTLGPSPAARQRATDLARRLPRPGNWLARGAQAVASVAAFPLAGVTAASLRVPALQHPKLRRHDWSTREHPAVLEL